MTDCSACSLFLIIKFVTTILTKNDAAADLMKIWQPANDYWLIFVIDEVPGLYA